MSKNPMTRLKFGLDSMKNILLDIIIWIAVLFIIGLGSLLYGAIIKNSVYSDIGTIVIIDVSIMYLITTLIYYLISKLIND